MYIMHLNKRESAMKLGIIVVGKRHAGKTTCIKMVKEKIGINTTQTRFDCCGNNNRGFIISGSWDELELRTPAGVHDHLMGVCDNHQVIVIPSWHEDVPGSYLPIYLNVFRGKEFKVIRVDVMKMEEEEAVWMTAKEHLADYVYALVKNACPDLQR